MAPRLRTLCTCLLILLSHGAWAQFPPGATNYTTQVYATPSPGYICMSPTPQVPVFNEAANLMVCDAEGELVWYAPLADQDTGPFQTIFTADFKPLGNGSFSYFVPGDGGGKFMLLDSGFNLVDSIWCTGIANTDAHDIFLDADGNYTILCDSTITGDASSLTTNGGVQGSSNAQILYQIVQKQSPNRSVLWNWASLDHQPIANSDTAQFTSPSFLDHTHMNSLWFDPQGKVVISSRNLNEITRFDPLTGAIDWRFGGKANDFTLIGDTEFFSAQHDANFTDDGRLYLFDNGSVGAHRVARYVEYQLDTVAMTATLIREHRHPNNLLSRYMGNALLLPDDNVILSWGGVFPEDSTVDIVEYLPDGNPTLEIDLPGGFFTYRVYKGGLGFQLERPILTCDNGLQRLSAPAGHSTYWWNTGDTTREITVAAPGKYQVWVDHGIGRLSSEPVWVTDVGDVCLALDSGTSGVAEMQIGPNPFEDRLQIWLPEGLRSGWKLEVYDGVGRQMLEREGHVLKTSIEASNWPKGVYFLRVQGSGRTYRERILKR